jgi:Uma2 family endonuclease
MPIKASPDEALVKREKFAALSAEDREKLVPLAPDIAAELISKSEEYGQKRAEVEARCQALFENGVRYVIMLDPYTQDGAKRVTTWGIPPEDFPDTWDDVLDA